MFPGYSEILADEDHFGKNQRIEHRRAARKISCVQLIQDDQLVACEHAEEERQVEEDPEPLNHFAGKLLL